MRAKLDDWPLAKPQCLRERLSWMFYDILDLYSTMVFVDPIDFMFNGRPDE